MKASFKVIAASLAAMFLSAAAASATTCTGPSSVGIRLFTTTTAPDTSTCYGSGNDHIGLDSTDGVLNYAGANAVPGLVLLDQIRIDTKFADPAASSEAEDGSLGIIENGNKRPADGTFSIGALSQLYKNFVLVLKVGEGKLNPDWAGFLLPKGVLGGSYFVDSGLDSKGNPVGYLIEARLYAQPIPLPAAGLLLLGALAGFGALARRRTAA